MLACTWFSQDTSKFGIACKVDPERIVSPNEELGKVEIVANCGLMLSLPTR